VTNRQTFAARGVIIQVKPAERLLEIRHEEIKGYMPPMTMPFTVKDTNELAGLQPGDFVSFQLVDAGNDGWVEQIHKLSRTNEVAASNQGTNANARARGEFRVVRDVEPLSPGDLMPVYHFTNQFGVAFDTTKYKGQAVALCFLFTRCPFPTFCPRTALNYAETQKKLLALPNAPTNWHLLTITFDPEHDTPDKLKPYAEAYGYDPLHWTFATSDLVEITAIADQFGCQFWHDETGSISHNLRTAVIDASGRVQRILPGNTWSSDELVQEIVKASSADPKSAVSPASARQAGGASNP
jgi:protein SCO1/2